MNATITVTQTDQTLDIEIGDRDYPTDRRWVRVKLADVRQMPHWRVEWGPAGNFKRFDLQGPAFRWACEHAGAILADLVEADLPLPRP